MTTDKVEELRTALLTQRRKVRERADDYQLRGFHDKWIRDEGIISGIDLVLSNLATVTRRCEWCGGAFIPEVEGQHTCCVDGCH